MNYEQQLFQLASDLNAVAKTASYKEAAYGVGGQQVMPSTPYQNAAGLYDPNPANAGYSALSQARSDINASTILDGQVSGTNLLPQRPVLNEGYQTVASAMNPPMGFNAGAMGGGGAGMKYASDDEHFQKMASTGLFEDGAYPDQQGWGLIVENAFSKVASNVEGRVMDMINSGALDKVNPNLKALFLGQL